jgi:ORF6N domain
MATSKTIKSTIKAKTPKLAAAKPKSVPFTNIVPKPENLASMVLAIRGEKVLLDTDLAELYGVEARALNQAVARNFSRFPGDFMFQLTAQEWESEVTNCDLIQRQRQQLITNCDERQGK